MKFFLFFFVFGTAIANRATRVPRYIQRRFVVASVPLIEPKQENKEIKMNVKDAVCARAAADAIIETFENLGRLQEEVDAGKWLQKKSSLGDELDRLVDETIKRFIESIEEMVKAKMMVVDVPTEEMTSYKFKIRMLLDARLKLICLSNLIIVRDKIINDLAKSLHNDNPSSELHLKAMNEADDTFQEDIAANRPKQHSNLPNFKTQWDADFKRIRKQLRMSMHEKVSLADELIKERLSQKTKQESILRYIGMQQQQLLQLQQAYYGQQGANPYSLVLSYRFTNSNLNLSANFSGGKSEVHISCVPDDSAHLLGAQGFVHGVTPGNIGISFNLKL
eukprot:GHVL01037590.1.p1 GENE.GHVL01037590.1~~GHVL01037590.1.p1  ORF type:complete len:335 (+),score=60.40 GHVL01037590.1:25-1029(+)